MTLIQLAVIALVQGTTEFLPISSSGHLILIPNLTGWQDQGLVIDVAVHVGTLGAVITYLWRDIWMMITGLFKPGNIRRNPGLRLIAQIIVATIPLAIVGAVVYNISAIAAQCGSWSGGRRWASASCFIWRTVLPSRSTASST